MTEYNEGDLVEAVNDSGDKLTGRLGVTETGHFYLGAYNWTFPNWVAENAGFKHITVIEKAAPKNVLPTEAGIYADAEGAAWQMSINGHGDPEWHYGKDFWPLDQVLRVAPFTRLEPVPVTAKKVLSEVRKEAETRNGNPWNASTTIDAVAARYGVSS